MDDLPRPLIDPFHVAQPVPKPRPRDRVHPPTDHHWIVLNQSLPHKVHRIGVALIDKLLIPGTDRTIELRHRAVAGPPDCRPNEPVRLRDCGLRNGHSSATADAIADAGDYVFRVVPPNRRQAEDCATFARKKLNAARVSILYLNNDYGLSLQQAFEPAFKALGGQIVSVNSFESGATDYRTQLTRIKQIAPDVVFFPDHYKETALILKQARELGVKSQFLGCDGACTDDLIKLGGAAAEGTYYSNLAIDFNSSNPQVQAFVRAFREKYGQDPDAYAAYAYDAARYVGRAVTEGGYSADAVKRFLYDMPRYEGVTGSTKFDSRGEVDKPFDIQVVRDGKFQAVR